MKSQSVRAASILFWLMWTAMLVATIVALSGMAQAQHICQTEGFEGLLSYFHPVLEMGLRGKATIAPFKCSTFQFTQWMTFSNQAWYLIAAAAVVLLKKLPQYKVAVVASGALATTLCAILCWNALEFGGGVYGDLKSAAERTFWGCFICCIVNPAAIYALCDVDFALKLKRKEEKAVVIQAVQASTDAPSEEDFKRSSSQLADAV